VKFPGGKEKISNKADKILSVRAVITCLRFEIKKTNLESIETMGSNVISITISSASSSSSLENPMIRNFGQNNKALNLGGKNHLSLIQKILETLGLCFGANLK
jgi:hypothetical protein